MKRFEVDKKNPADGSVVRPICRLRISSMLVRAAPVSHHLNQTHEE